MSNDVYIFEVSEKNFDQVVIHNSHTLPVVAEFLGVWSGPCIMMADTLSDLAKEFAGKFIFAKVDIDEQPELRKKYSIQNLPTSLVFKNGEIALREEGELKERDLRIILQGLGIFHESDILREQAREKHLAGDTPSAIMLLTEAIKKDPSNTRVAMDMVQIFIDIDQIDSANGLFRKLPEKDRSSDMGKSLSGQLAFAELAAKTEGLDTLRTKVLLEANNHAARFDLAICQVAQHQYPEALDNLLLILKQDNEFKQGAAKELYITIINMLTPTRPELAQQYRVKLSNIVNA